QTGRSEFRRLAWRASIGQKPLNMRMHKVPAATARLFPGDSTNRVCRHRHHTAGNIARHRATAFAIRKESAVFLRQRAEPSAVLLLAANQMAAKSPGPDSV